MYTVEQVKGATTRTLLYWKRLVLTQYISEWEYSDENDYQRKVTEKQADLTLLKAELANREHILNKPEAKAARRAAATQERGNSKGRQR